MTVSDTTTTTTTLAITTGAVQYVPNNNSTTLTANQKSELLLWSGLCAGPSLIRAQKLVGRSDMVKSMKGEEHTRSQYTNVPWGATTLMICLRRSRVLG